MIKTKRASEEQKKKWCPMARVSIQRILSVSGDKEVVDAVQTGAFNIVHLANDNRGHQASYCLLDRCPLYREGLPWQWGRCKLATPSPWGTILFSIVCIVSAVGWFFLRGGI